MFSSLPSHDIPNYSAQSVWNLNEKSGPSVITEINLNACFNNNSSQVFQSRGLDECSFKLHEPTSTIAFDWMFNIKEVKPKGIFGSGFVQSNVTPSKEHPIF